MLQLAIFGFFIKSIAVYQIHGRKAKFTTRKIKEWLLAIQEAKTALKGEYSLIVVEAGLLVNAGGPAFLQECD